MIPTRLQKRCAWPRNSIGWAWLVVRQMWRWGALPPVMQRFLVTGVVIVALNAQEINDRPLLTVDQAVQIAIDNNRSLKLASLDVEKSKWQLAEVKTNRLPVIKSYIFAAGNLNSPAFDFKQATFGTIGNTPIPGRDTMIALSSGIGGSQLFQIAQPISQLYKANLGIREQK
jgi:hypothetical protein